MNLSKLSSYKTYIYLKHNKSYLYKYNIMYRLPKHRLPVSSFLFILSASLVNNYSMHDTSNIYISIPYSSIYIIFLLPCVHQSILYLN